LEGETNNQLTNPIMNTTTRQILRTAALAALLAVSSTFSLQAAAPSASDSALNALTLTGSVDVKAAGPYVEVGSYRIWVSSHLGKPSLALADGTWLYNEFAATGSGANGTLLVRFNHGQVSEMKLVSPAVVAVLKATTKSNGVMIADSRR
jgi:hypothetical protein